MGKPWREVAASSLASHSGGAKKIMKEPYKLYITIREPMMMFQDCVCCAKPNTSDVKEIREENYLHGGCIILNLYKET